MSPRSLFVMILLGRLLTCCGVVAQTKGKSDSKMVKRLKTDISYLASDELQGRLTGSEGEHKAAAYIRERYQSEGIKPYKSGYLHPFHFIYGKEINEATEIRIGNSIMKIPDEAFPLPFSASKQAYSELLPDVMEQGNIWMVGLYNDSGEAADPHFNAEKVINEKAKDAEKQGAKGLLVYDGIGSKWEPAYNKLSEYESLNIPVAFLTYDAYNKYVQNKEYMGKNNGGLPVQLSINVKKAEREGTNVTAFIDNKARYTVVIGAHYDHLGYGEDGNSLYAGKEKKIHHGADDNASGTAAVLEIANYIKTKRLHHYNYLFINFSGEELGLLGSKNFVKDEGTMDSAHIAFMLNLDMVGRLNDSTHALTLGGIGTSPAWGALISKPVKKFRWVIDSSGVGPSDHTSFYHQGIPVLFFFTGTHKDYHKPSDIAANINYRGEESVIKYIESVVVKMDKMPKPKFTPTRQNAIGRVNFKVTLGIMPDYSFQGGGVRVDGVSDDRPAMKAGVKEGDVITALGDYKVNGMQSYMEALGKFSPGDKTNVTVIRSDKPLVLPITLSK